MKRYILFLAISVFALVSCTKDESTPSPDEKSGIALDVVCSTMTPATKAGISGTQPGDNDYNENIIKTIDYYFYPEGGTGANAVLEGRVSPNQLSQYTVNVAIDEAMLNTTLFPRPNNTCQVAVLVNYPGNHPTGNTKVSDLEVKTLALQLTTDGKGKDQSEFVMFGVKQVELISRKATLIANPIVDVHRVACKITLDAYVDPSIVAPVQLIDGGKTYTLNQVWKPMIDQMYIYLENGVSNALVSGDPEASKPYSYFKYSQEEFTNKLATHTITRKRPSTEDPSVMITTTETHDDFHVSPPFYTYPQKWVTSDPKEPFLKLVLPWTREAGDDHETNPDWATKPHTWGSIQKSFYYRIMLPNISTGFVSNNWYHINLDVAILGSDIDDASVDIVGTYWVVPWGTTTPVEADIKGSRYLSVSQLNHTMYNTTQLKIPYVTSNKCKIDNLSVRQYNFRNDTWTNHTSTATSGNWVTLDNNNNIVINHTLNNDITSNSFDVAPYEFTFTIRHDDSEGNVYYKEITVIQYPGMYIEKFPSDTYLYIKGIKNLTTSGGTMRYANTYDDQGQQNQYTNLGHLYDRRDAMSFANNNPNQYSIHVSVLPDNYKYSIGDPRVEEGISGSETGSLIYRLDGLSNYKPTDTSINTQNLISPQFRVASSYGKCQSAITYQGAVKRCAAYQENGYPAGRWRLPTKAEIEYLITLSDKGKIPELFSGTISYWAGGGLFLTNTTNNVRVFKDVTGITPNNLNYSFPDGSSYNNIRARCVYDEWFWGAEPYGTADQWYGYKPEGVN